MDFKDFLTLVCLILSVVSIVRFGWRIAKFVISIAALYMIYIYVFVPYVLPYLT